MITLEICHDNTKLWYANGRPHRLDGPARVWADGDQEWWTNGQRHRLDGPAFIGADGYQAWYKQGQRHRASGPAIVYHDGTVEYWINNAPVTEYEIMFIEPTI